MRGQDAGGKQEYIQVESQGAASLDQGPPASTASLVDKGPEIHRQSLEDLTRLVRGAAGIASPLAFPVVPNSAIAKSNLRFRGFDGLNHADQRLAGTGAYANTQFSLEPPDQALCVGNGFLVESVNLALAVYRVNNGARISGPTALNQFFRLAPAVVRSSPPVFGPFLSDPRCFYDSGVNRFFLTITELDTDPKTGNFLGPSSVLIAVSQTADPTKNWNLFRLRTTAHGVNCPCFGDEPLIGADANGLHISTNAFSVAGGGFGGVQIYSLSKLFLAAGAPPPFVLHIALPAAFNPDGSIAVSVHPASNAQQNWARFGTEYFLSDFNIVSPNGLENKVVVWALRNTFFLNIPVTPATNFNFLRKAVASEVYGVPPDAFQKKGTLLLGPLVDPNVFEILATNDQRMQQVTLANGHLWSAVTTRLLSPGETSLKAGIAWFSVDVDSGNGDSTLLQAEMDSQGYIALANAAVFFPAVGVTGEGGAAIGFSISGPAYFPSTGYVQLGQNGKSGPIHFTGIGVNSEDGLTGYPDAVAPPPPPCLPGPNGTLLCEARWGDYGAAAIGDDGSIWLGSEYIGPRPRTLFANWGTFITHLQPSDDNDEN
jgi:hypothetical protein